MNEPIDDPMDDKQLQDYLAGNSPVSQRYRELASDEVPSHLDELVLKQSREAVATVSLEQERLRRSRQRLKRWSIPATLAASTVLVVSIVIESGNRHQVMAPLEVQMPTRIVEEAAPAAPVASDKLEAAREPQQEASADVSAIQQPQRDASSAAPALQQSLPVASPVVPPSEKRSKAAPATVARKPSDAGAVSKFAEPPKADAKASAEEEVVVVTELRKQQPPALESPSAITAIAAKDSINPVASPPPPAAAPPAVSEPAPMSGNMTAMQGSGVASAQRRERAASESKNMVPDAAPDLSEVAVTGTRVRRATPSVGPRGTISQNAATDSRADAGEADAWRDEPESWLAHIRQLRADGSNDDADKEWKRFLKAHPNYAVAETDAARPKR